jgi:hypothetical protein
MADEARAAPLYLELLKKALTFSLWEEPAEPLERLNHLRSPLSRLGVRALARAVRLLHPDLLVARKQHVDEEARRRGMLIPMYAHTMVGRQRLDNLHACVETTLRDGVAGDLVETGVWRGGACILMRGILAAHGVTDRRVFVADSFAGLPRPDAAGYPADAHDVHHTYRHLVVSRGEVEESFRRFGLLDEQVVFLEGWFRDTLPAAPIDRLAVLRLDGDMYQSTMEALTFLYPKLSPGGFCIVDDYGGIESCRRAVEAYRSRHGITEAILPVDWTGVYWRREAAT